MDCLDRLAEILAAIRAAVPVSPRETKGPVGFISFSAPEPTLNLARYSGLLVWATDSVPTSVREIELVHAC